MEQYAFTKRSDEKGRQSELDSEPQETKKTAMAERRLPVQLHGTDRQRGAPLIKVVSAHSKASFSRPSSFAISA